MNSGEVQAATPVTRQNGLNGLWKLRRKYFGSNPKILFWLYTAVVKPKYKNQQMHA